MGAEYAQHLGEILVSRHDHPTLEGGDVMRIIETERTDATE